MTEKVTKMQEIKCPRCGEVFQVNAETLKQAEIDRITAEKDSKISKLENELQLLDKEWERQNKRLLDQHAYEIKKKDEEIEY